MATINITGIQDSADAKVFIDWLRDEGLAFFNHADLSWKAYQVSNVSHVGDYSLNIDVEFGVLEDDE